MIELLGVRHAQAVKCKEERDIITGLKVNPGLTEVGREQATEFGRLLNHMGFMPAVVGVSTRARAQETWDLARQELPIDPVAEYAMPELDEVAWGSWEGKRRSEVITPEVEAVMLRSFNYRPNPEAETLHEMHERFVSGVSFILDKLADVQEVTGLEDVSGLIVTHSMDLRVLLAYSRGTSRRAMHEFNEATPFGPTEFFRIQPDMLTAPRPADGV